MAQSKGTQLLDNRLPLPLATEVGLFRTWAAAEEQSPQYRSGEWEADYEYWPQINTAFANFLRDNPLQSWDAQTYEMLLYIVARNNECGFLAHELFSYPDALLVLAHSSLASSESDAKWQIAVRLSQLDGYRTEVEQLLIQFTQDESEYVRRRSLMALGHIKSSQVEGLVEAAWQTGYEYQRMAVLNALFNVGSDKLTEYLGRVKEDDNPYLIAYAARIRNGQGD